MTTELPAGIDEHTEPLPHVEFATDACRGAVFDHGAHVTSWVPAGQDPVIWLSPNSRFDDASAIRGGVPICFPWFGAGANGLPQHGVARTSAWRRVSVIRAGDDVIVTHVLTADAVAPDVRGAFPDDATATMRSRFGTTLQLSLEVTAGASPVDYAAALHTYLAVSDVEQIEISGLADVPYDDRAFGGTGSDPGPIQPAGEIDRLYDAAPVVTIADPDRNRTITVTPSGSAQTVVWTPGATKAAAMADLGAEAYRGFICVEAVATGAHSIHLDPGQSHVLEATYSIG